MIEPFRMFAVRVERVRRLSPTFLRVTFTGEDLHLFADNGFDQRIKLILPVPEHGLAYVPTGPDWFTQWRSLPDDRRNPIRTYTIRKVRHAERAIDVDMVMHADGGPAARWAETAREGDAVVVLGPDARYGERHGGLEFHPPADTGAVLIAGDETAVPAVCGILEGLPPGIEGEALLEVPHADDVLETRTRSAVKVTWLARGDAPHGEALIAAVRSAADRLLPPQAEPGSLPEVDVDAELLWEVPDEAAMPYGPLYAWLAGEAAVIKTLRRHLVAERGMDRRSVAFMGYWRHGRAEIDA
ncbi:siderophore-interacting protein [Nonomuraea sediminis]|uniref:siderophore-interacting protein n=1 Tax=Nonomuraea sediminis TaxID=2835864 RepID=UPI002029C858|nr:siderophore-interacting protein [Nonomuraea sediminis]